MAISREQVWQAADELVTASAKVTLEAVRVAIGTGSYATIRKYLAEWRGRQSRAEAAVQAPVPESLEQMCSKMVADAWGSALLAADRRIASEREALRETGEQAERDMAEIAALADRQQADLVNAMERIAKLDAALAEANEERIRLQRNLAAESASKAALEQEILRRETAYNELQKNANGYLARCAGMDARIDELKRVNDSLVYRMTPKAKSDSTTQGRT